MYYTDMKRDGKYYLGTLWGYQEVSKEVYYEYMRFVWRERKARRREVRCFDWENGRRCDGNCEECEFECEGSSVSLNRLMEDSKFDIADPRRESIEDMVIKKMMIEALYAALDELLPDDKYIIEALYLFEEPMTQKAVGAELGISRQAVAKRTDRILSTLHEALKDWED